MNVRATSQGAAVAFALLLGGCGEPAPSQAPSAPTPAPRGEREAIDPAHEARVRERRLAPRAKPLEVGATAPQVEGVPLGQPAVLVFYRGHW